MIDFSEALERLLSSASPVGAERVGLSEALGRVLAEDVASRSPMPAFDHSSMDGYALASDSLQGDGPFTFPVAGESAAGGALPKLAPQTVCRIFTGARLPEGADAVIMQERVERSGDTATFSHRPAPFEHVRRRGADLAEGKVALAKGTRLGPGHVALAAALDRPELLVARRPVVTILGSGDELRAPGEPGEEGSIPESNSYFVAAAARAAGASARVAPFVRDDAEASRAAVAEALRGSDLVVTIGGVSVGDRDVVRPALEAAGVTLDFWRVRIKPGKPLAVGRAGAIHVLGLPGNPASAALTFLLFGAPLIRRLQGDANPLPSRQRMRVAPAASVLVREPGRQEFARARLDRSGPELVARLLPNQASGAATSFAEAEVLVVIPAELARVEEGDRLEVIRLGEI